MNNKKGLILVLLTTIIFSCEKEKDLTKTEIITQKPWKLTAKTINPAIDYPGIGIISDFFALYNDCSKDDIWVFKSTGSYTMEEGATKCNTTDPTVWDMGTWTFNSDETVLTTASNIYGLSEYDIVELTTAALKLRYQLIDTLDNIYTVNESYGH
jgi:hypothetical protein